MIFNSLWIISTNSIIWFKPIVLSIEILNDWLHSTSVNPIAFNTWEPSIIWEVHADPLLSAKNGILDINISEFNSGIITSMIFETLKYWLPTIKEPQCWWF